MMKTLSIKDARYLAKYYGKVLQSNPDSKEDWEALHYLRCLILKKKNGQKNS